jgi:hypothetical protein
MSISVNVGNLIPAEVVEVGNEISVNQLAAITAATDPSATNPFSTAGHTHVIANVTGLQAALDGKVGTAHTHAIADVTNLQNILDSKSGVSHSHTIGNITGLPEALADKASLVHTHAIADTTGLQTALDSKSATTHLHTGVYAPVAHTHAIADTTGLQTALDGKSATTHNHNGTYAPITHTHAIADVTGLQTAIDGKLNLTGGTMTGGLVFALSDTDARITFNDGSIQSTSAYSKEQTDSYVSTLTGWINGKADLAGATFSGEISAPQIGNLLNQDLIIDAYNDTGAGTHYYHKFTPTGGFILAPNDGYVQAGQYSLSNQGFASYWIYQGDIGRSLKLNQSGLTWDVTKNFNYVLNVGFTFNDKVTLTSPTVDNPTINIGSVASTAIPANALAGDVWIGTWQMCYKTNNGTVVYGAATNLMNSFTGGQSIDGSTSTPALRVTQRGTGNALVVEDTTTPDTSSFLVNNDGKVYVNYNPATATDTVADLRVTKKSGSSYAAFFDSQAVNDGGSTVAITCASNGSPLVCIGGITRLEGGVKIGSTGVQIERINVGFNAPTPVTYSNEVEIRMNGNTFRIPCRII